MQLPLSVWSSYYVDLAPEAMVDEFAACGYRYTEFSDEHGAMLLERAAGIPNGAEKVGAALQKYAAGRGIRFPQGHLWLRIDLCSGDAAVETLKRWLDLFLALGIRASVLHASGGAELSPDERLAVRANAVAQLAAYLHGTDMVLCLENLMAEHTPRHADDLLTLIDAAGGGEHLGICLDTGHLHAVSAKAGATESQSDFIRTAGRRLRALHIADNDGTRDQHLMPFGLGTVDWQDVMRGLRAVGYDGLFNLEVPGERRAPLDVRRAKLTYIQAVGAHLMSLA